MQSNANDAVMETGLASASLMIPFVEPCGVLENLQRTTGEIAFIQHPPQIANLILLNNPRHNNMMPKEDQGEKISDY